MPTFEEAKKNLRSRQQENQSLRQDLNRNRNRLRTTDLRKSKVERTDPDGQSDLSTTLVSDQQNIEEQLIANRQEQLDLGLALERARQAFLPFSDPRKHMGRMSDHMPILLFPLRLETRFKKIETAEAGIQYQLWVRVYPDECLIDTFETIPSEAEYLRTRSYWINHFRAGISTEGTSDEVYADIRARRLSAWNGLLEQSTAGRAYWLTQNLKPISGQTPPFREKLDDIVLVIPTDMDLEERFKKPLAEYYEVLWRTPTDKNAIASALQALVDEVGSTERAEDILARFQPAGLADDDPRNARADQLLEVVFLDFPPEGAIDRTVSAWSEPARVDMLPDRLLVQGYKNGALVVDQIGPLIPKPLVVGPDPGEDIEAVLKEAYPDLFEGDAAPSDEEKAGLYVAYLSSRADTRWLYDFDSAVEVGMGFRINLSESAYNAGFDRLFVLGVRLSSDQRESQDELEQMLSRHQYGTNGLAILPQGLATNRTEDEESPYTQFESAEATFDRLINAPNINPVDSGRETRKDGQWLADMLGVDPSRSGLATALHYDHTDQCESLAMQRALYPATMGRYLDSMLDSLTSEWERSVTAELFRSHVAPRGRMPSVRIGKQPYGVLSVSTRKKGEWLKTRPVEEAPAEEIVFEESEGEFIPGRNLHTGQPFPGFGDHKGVLRDTLGLLERIREDWTPLLADVPHLHGPGTDPHKKLLAVLGLHATSVEFDQRMGETVKQFFNRLKAGGLLGTLIGIFIAGSYLQRSKDLLERHGIRLDQSGDEDISLALPKIIELLFLQNHTPLVGPLIDDSPLSEFRPIRAYSTSGQNYIEWLIDSMQSNPRNLRTFNGIPTDDRPDAMLFQLLKYATEQAANRTALNLYRGQNLLSNDEYRRILVETDFVGIRQNIGNAVETPYELLYRAEPSIAPTDGGRMVVDHLPSLLAPDNFNGIDWRLHKEALEKLAKLPTARLERLMAEHIDCCNYRLDAWLQAFTNMKLHGMRYGTILELETQQPKREGIYLGAYGWVENLVPQDRRREVAELADDQQGLFASDGQLPETDSSNAGYAHAPSLDHAATAAVLRNAYLSQSNADDPDYYSVNLSSERVRMALHIIEGMQGGQELGALLGYRLERGLHDSSQQLDQYIYPLRKKFPLRANRLTDTALEEDDFDSIEQIAANNVVDGLWLLEEDRKPSSSYPWGIQGMPDSISDKGRAIIAEVEKLKDINDAVADLSLAESVHQVVKGNYDRAAGTLNAFSKGGVPPIPEVVKTPRRGSQLNHRMALHFDPTASVTGSVIAQAEPAIASWIGKLLPEPEKIGVIVERVTATGKMEPPVVVTLADLNMTAIDLLYRLDREGDNALGMLDEPIHHFIQQSQNPAVGTDIKIHYTKPLSNSAAASVSIFELVPLINDLRELLLATRPLRPTDLRLPGEADGQEDGQMTLSATKYDALKTAMLTSIGTNATEGLRGDIDDLTTAGVDIDDLEAMKSKYGTILDNIDAWVETYAGRAHDLQTFRPLNAHTDFAYNGLRGLYLFQRELVSNFRDELFGLFQTSKQLLDDETALDPVTATDEDRMTLLKKVEPLVSTSFIINETDTVGFRAAMVAKQGAFEGYLNELQTYLDKDHATLKEQTDELLDLLSETKLEPFTTRRVDLTEAENRLLSLAQDLLRASTELVNKADILVAQAQAVQTEFEGMAVGPEAVVLWQKAMRILVGEDFQVLPRFELSALAKDELDLMLVPAHQSQLLEFQMATKGDPFPIDTWLNGLARVRPMAGAWERTGLFTEDYESKEELTLTPLQFPYRAEDSWLGLEFPSNYELDEERLLYTAHFAEDSNTGSSYCGLLLDEWTEVIPARQEDTGLTFHFDRPNNEPPQAWLLAVPERFKGGWEWQELVGCLHEALDLAQLRAIEPESFANTAYSHMLPTTVAGSSSTPVIASLNYAAVNGVQFNVQTPDTDVVS